MTQGQIYNRRREQVILLCMALGYQRKEIAEILGLSLVATKKACTRIFRSHNTDNSTSTVAVAIAKGIIPNPYDSSGNIRQEIIDDFLMLRKSSA